MHDKVYYGVCLLFFYPIAAYNLPIQVLYMYSSFRLLRVESGDSSQAEKGRTACKAEQIHKMTTIFSEFAQLCKQLPIWPKIDN